MAVLARAADLHFELHARYRECLACRPAPPPVDLPAALGYFNKWNGAERVQAWIDDGRPADARAPDGFYVDPVVSYLRWRRHIEGAPKAARAYAAGHAILRPEPDVVINPWPQADEEYGRRCVEYSQARSWPLPEITPDFDFEAYGRRRRAAWIGAYGRSDRNCQYSHLRGRARFCALMRLPPRVPHHEFWSLVADERPVIISATSGRLIDGLRRVEAHRAAGDRSPGVPVEWRVYEDDDEEFSAAVEANGANPHLDRLDRARIVDPALRDKFRREAARNSGHARYEEPRHSSAVPDVGPTGRPRRPPKPVRVNDRLAAAAGMSRPTFERCLRQAAADMGARA